MILIKAQQQLGFYYSSYIFKKKVESLRNSIYFCRPLVAEVAQLVRAHDS